MRKLPLYLRGFLFPFVFKHFFPLAGGVDLAFIVDVGSTGSRDHFSLVMNYIRSVFHSFTMSNSVRYGLVFFGSDVKVR